MKRLSIRTRVTVWYTLFMIAIMAVAFTALYLGGVRTMKNYYQNALISTSRLAADDIRRRNGMLEIDRNLNALPNVRVSLYSEWGELLYGRTLFDLPFSAEVMRPVSGYRGDSWYAYDVLLTFEDGESVWLRCAIPSMAASLSEFVSTEMLVLLPLLVFLAGVGGSFITKQAFRPVQRIAETAESIADGRDLKKRIPTGGARDELNMLANVFNAMLDRLNAAFEREQRFTSDASHELRTPVAAILSQSEFALSEYADDAIRREALEDIHLRAERMSGLIGRLLSLTRMDSGRTVLNADEIDMAELAEIIAEQYGEAAQRKNMQITCTADAPAPLIGDQTMLTQALMNLVGNAVKYGNEGGRITVHVAQDSDSVRTEVRDDGPGIAAEDLPHLFERFYQADRSRHEEGAGLGLPLVRLIAELHGGSVTVTSTVGAGSCFSLILPKRKKER